MYLSKIMISNQKFQGFIWILLSIPQAVKPKQYKVKDKPLTSYRVVLQHQTHKRIVLILAAIQDTRRHAMDSIHFAISLENFIHNSLHNGQNLCTLDRDHRGCVSFLNGYNSVRYLWVV
ncbi:unnamed protein product [Ilex paraguariensis]|uniref:Uncharacterized protein n=1 Tax=Ilex paraguariensis TaxID=185542 RepID=A0ABC8S7L6_9AQUA